MNEFERLTIPQLEQMVKDLEDEAWERERDCMERWDEARARGEVVGSHNAACDYVADDLYQRAERIREEIRAREEMKQ